MNQYEEIDRRILKAIEQRSNPLCSQQCRDEAKRLAETTGRESFRVIDGRLQAMRKAGKIQYRTKVGSGGQGGWHLVTPNAESNGALAHPPRPPG